MTMKSHLRNVAGWAAAVTLHRAARCLLAFAAATSLAACVAQAPAPQPQAEAAAVAPDEVELTLNIPAEPADCACEDEVEGDRTFLERGMETLASGDYVEAVQYFQRYRRLEPNPLAQWEADLAIAYVSMLSSSPFYDVDAALTGYTDLQGREPQGRKAPQHRADAAIAGVLRTHGASRP